ncbi:MAG: hypothetical protein ACREYE_07615 [Gammaproteobacteria bacterium]
MYIYDRKFSGAKSLLKEQPITSRPAQRNSYFPDRGKSGFGARRGSSGSYVWANEGVGELSPDTRLRPHLSDADTSTRKAVGERVELDLNKTAFAGNINMDKIRWTIPGRVVRGYDGNVRDSKLFELTKADLERPKVSFFWVDAADRRIVRAIFRLKSPDVLAQVVFVFDVKGPRMNHFTGKTDVTRIEKRAGLTGMRFGKPIEAPGIKWKWKITMPPNHAGFIKDVQTVLNDRSQIQSLKPGGKDTRKLVWRHPSKTNPHVQLDGHSDDQAAYTAGLYEPKIGAGESFTNERTSDSPHSELPPLAKTVSVNDQFTPALHKFSLFAGLRQLSEPPGNATARRGRLGLRTD